MRRIVIDVILVVGLIGLVGAVQQKPKSVTYERVVSQGFWLTDSKGKLRAVMSAGFNGDPFIQMTSKNGTRVSMSADDIGPSIVFSDAKKVNRLSMQVQRDVAGITLSDANRKPRLRLTVSPDGASSVIFTNAAGKLIRSVSVSKEGIPFGVGN
ncbi:hypothetical protein HOH51_03925 [bacterium]|jgi:hypothetical protein|nr:hypothetical protein [bacterium]